MIAKHPQEGAAGWASVAHRSSRPTVGAGPNEPTPLPTRTTRFALTTRMIAAQDTSPATAGPCTLRA